MVNKFVKQHTTSYVLGIITVKITNHNELENLCLTDSKILEIEYSFKMKENDYHSLIALLFGTDKFINDITDAFAFNHPISTQEYTLSVNCEKSLQKIQINQQILHPTLKSKSN